MGGGIRRRRRIFGSGSPAVGFSGRNATPEVCVDLSPLLAEGWDQTFGLPKLCIHRGRVYGQGTIGVSGIIDGEMPVLIPSGGIPAEFRPPAPAQVQLWTDSVNVDDCDIAGYWPSTINPDGSWTIGTGGGFGNYPRGSLDPTFHLNLARYDLRPTIDVPTYESLGPYMLSPADFVNVDAEVAEDGRVHFRGHVQGASDFGASLIVPSPDLPAKYNPHDLVAGKAFTQDGRGWTVQAGGNGFMQVAHGAASPHTFHLENFDGYIYTHTDYGTMADDGFGSNFRTLPDPPPLPADYTPSTNPARPNWVQVTFNVFVQSAAQIGDGAGVYMAYTAGSYYALFARKTGSSAWRYELYRVSGGVGTLVTVRGPYSLSALGSGARQTMDVWTSGASTGIEFRDVNPTFSSSLLLASPFNFNPLGGLGLLELPGTNGRVEVQPEIRAQLVYPYGFPSRSHVLDLSTIGWHGSDTTAPPPQIAGDFHASAGAGGIVRDH